jgi:hypothetical protein
VAEREAELGRRHVWSRSLALGWVHDDNVNAGPSSDLVDLGNQIVAQEPKADTGIVLRATLGHRYQSREPLGFAGRRLRLFWESLAILSSKNFLHEKDEDLDILALRTGPWVAFPGGGAASLALRGDYLRYRGADYAWLTSLTPALAWDVGLARATLDLTLINTDYRRAVDEGLDGWQGSVGLRLDRPLGTPALRLYLGARLSDEETEDFPGVDDVSFANRGYEWFAGATYRPRPGLSWSAGFRHRHLTYEGDWSRFGAPRREDDQDWLDLSVELDLPWGLPGEGRLEAGYGHTQRHSKIPQLYSFERNQFFAALRWSF